MKRTPRTRKPTVSVIGSGRLGTAFALALAAAGYKIEAVVSKGKVGATRAKALLGKNTIALALSHLSELPLSQLTLITTPDDAIAELAQSLSELPRGKGSATVLHTSGALSSEVLKPLTRVGFHTGSIHPLVSVSSPQDGKKTLNGAFYCVEGDRAAKRMAQSIVSDLHGESFSISPSKKALYHAAAVMSSGHLVALIDLAEDMLKRCGLSARDSRKILVPLLKSTMSNVEQIAPADALTGTFARGDLETVARHLEALETEDLYMALEVYRLLGAHSLQIAKHNPSVASRIEEISRLLNRFDK